MNTNDFNARTVKALARKGITILGPTAIPNMSSPMPWANASRAYKLDNNGQHQIRTHAEVLALATYYVEK